LKPLIVVPYDFSTASRQALAWAADLLRTTGGPPLHLVHAIAPTAGGAPDLSAPPPTDEGVRALEDLLATVAAEERVAATSEVLVRPGPTGAVVLEVVRERAGDLIVLGIHGPVALRRPLLGSVADHVVRHAGCPVVTVRGPAPPA
jgi:universal stress protein A